MKPVKIFGTIIIVSCLCLGIKMDSYAVLHVQYDYALVHELPKGANEKDYILLTEKIEHEVKEGDTLWQISRNILGSGMRYEEILEENKGIVTDEKRLMPGDTLAISKSLYIPKDQYDRGGLVSEGAFHIALPDIVEHDYFLDDDIFNVFLFKQQGSGISIFSLPKANDMGVNALTGEWEDFVKEVERCSATCDGRVSHLNFEKYEMEDGCDLCGYTFDFDTGDRTVEFAAFYRLGEQNMSEVIGVRDKEEGYDNMIDVTRYIAASFEDFGGATSIGFGGPPKKNVGADDWNYPELHNLFTAAMQNYLAEE